MKETEKGKKDRRERRRKNGMEYKEKEQKVTEGYADEKRYKMR